METITMKTEFELNANYVVDIELLRIEKLIEQRNLYEDEFLSLQPNEEVNHFY